MAASRQLRSQVHVAFAESLWDADRERSLEELRRALAVSESLKLPDQHPLRDPVAAASHDDPTAPDHGCSDPTDVSDDAVEVPRRLTGWAGSPDAVRAGTGRPDRRLRPRIRQTRRSPAAVRNRCPARRPPVTAASRPASASNTGLG